MDVFLVLLFSAVACHERQALFPPDINMVFPWTNINMIWPKLGQKCFVIRSLKPHMEAVKNARDHIAFVVEMLIHHVSLTAVKHYLLSHLKVQSHLPLFGKFSRVKSSHFNRNSCHHEFCVKAKDSPMQILHRFQQKAAWFDVHLHY